MAPVAPPRSSIGLHKFGLLFCVVDRDRRCQYLGAVNHD
jgi:hypothetical protein